MKRFYFLWIIPLAIIFIPFQTQAVDSREPEVKIYNLADFSLEKSFPAFDLGFRGGAFLAAGDLNGDGFQEIVAGAGPGGGPQVNIFSQEGNLIGHFFVYPEGFQGGVKVAVGDLDGDGMDEIITGPGRGGGPQVRTFSGQGEMKFTPGFLAYPEGFRGGVNVTACDVNGDGLKEIVTGAGPGGGPHVRVFDRYGHYLGYDAFPFDAKDHGGVAVGCANVDGGLEEEVIMGIYKYGRAAVKVVKMQSGTILGDFLAFPEAFQGGINVAGGDLDTDGFDEVLVAANTGGGPQLLAFEAYGASLNYNNFFVYEDDFRGGVNITVHDFDGDGQEEILCAPGRKWEQGRADFYKYIEVNITEQKLYVFKMGEIVDAYKVSTGLKRLETPHGLFRIYAKAEKTDMQWDYGPNHPDNYDLKDVPHVLYFYQGFTVHGAYWHHNFGHRMSHGCVNEPLDKAAWLYEWAEIGDGVWVHD